MLKPILGAACLCVATIVPANAQSEREPTRAVQPVFMVVNVANNSGLNIRSGPSARTAVVGVFQPGSRGITLTGDCRSMWCPVQHQGTSGWVYRAYLGNDNAQPGSQQAATPGKVAPDPVRRAAATPRQEPSAVEAKKSLPEVAFAYFIAQGWSEHQAAGIVGNLQAECGPGLTCSIGSGGIAQWRAERVTRFRNVFGYPFHKASFKDQLAYIQWELTHPNSPWKDSGRILKSAKDAASAAHLFDVHYERSSGGSRGARIANARAILKRYGGKSTS